MEFIWGEILCLWDRFLKWLEPVSSMHSSLGSATVGGDGAPSFFWVAYLRVTATFKSSFLPLAVGDVASTIYDASNICFYLSSSNIRCISSSSLFFFSFFSFSLSLLSLYTLLLEDPLDRLGDKTFLFILTRGWEINVGNSSASSALRTRIIWPSESVVIGKISWFFIRLAQLGSSRYCFLVAAMIPSSVALLTALVWTRNLMSSSSSS